MTELQKLATLMRTDWDRRIAHDYRFWMSDGHRDDTTMWTSGERDLAALLKGLPPLGEKTALEIGCGVGRLLRAAGGRCRRVLGFDVSEVAVTKARELLKDVSNVELYLGNGYGLAPIPDGTVDLVYSFAALSSMPTQVIASYLLDIRRVLRTEGQVRIQAYLGEEQIVCENDTLHLRCFKKENFIGAAELAGFRIENIAELELPFQVSFKDVGLEAVIISLVKSDSQPAAVEAVAQALLPGGEEKSTGDAYLSEIEYWMSVNYAKQLADEGEYERARDTLEFVAAHSQTMTLDVRDLLDQIVTRIAKSEEAAQKFVKDFARASPPPQAEPVPHAPQQSRAPQAEIFERNLKALDSHFPAAAQQARSLASRAGKGLVFPDSLEVRESVDGPVVFVGPHCLDHADKPNAAAQAWVKRTLSESRMAECEHVVVFGLGFGYHIAALLNERGSRRVSVIEPRCDVFVAALMARDLTALLDALDTLHIGEDIEEGVFRGKAELVVRPQHQVIAHNASDTAKAKFYASHGLSTVHPSIAVAGPVQGGTLPMTAYVQRALGVLEQKNRVYDFSGFAMGYHQMEKFVFDKMRQSSLQGTYIEMMSQVVLEAVNEKPVDVLICMAQAPISGRVLSELRRRGIITVLWFVEDYLRFTYWRETAQYYDFIFTIQRGDCLEAIRRAGAGEVHYLPTAADPGIHRPLELSPEERQRWGSPASFVGAGYHNRQQIFAGFAEMPVKLWGTEWPACRPFDRLVQDGGRRISPDEYVKIFNASDVNINLHSSTERDGVDPTGDFLNPRTFELAACGAFQLCDERSLLAECFEPGKEIITFSNARELRDQVNYYMQHKEERDAVAQRARERVLKEHTYAHRIKQMLSVIYSSKYEHLKKREAQSPWHRLRERSKRFPELNERVQRAYERGEEPNLDGLISHIVQGQGKLSDSEKKLLFLYHLRKQIIRMKSEENGG